MENYWCIKDMESTVVCVKRVKQEAGEEWDESMPLPGDIIEGVAAAEDEYDELFVPPKGRSELSSQLRKINQQQVEAVWLKVRRGNSTLKIRARIVPERNSLLHKRFTIKAAKDDRHVAVLGDLTFDQCTQLQEMSRKVVNVECRGYKNREVRYDWKMKVGSYLPDKQCSVVSSILFMPMQGEHSIESSTGRCMAWFSAAVSSGVPLVFVNIQTEQTMDSIWSVQQCHNSTLQISQGIRLWYLPGIAEIPLEMTPQTGEERFGIEIIPTDEGFICIYSVTNESAADRAGVGELYLEAKKRGQRLVMCRLEGKSLLPSSVCSRGLIHCCDQNDIKDTLASAIHQMDSIQLHFMAWPALTHSKSIGAASLRPPTAA